MAVGFSNFEEVQKYLDGEMTPGEEQSFLEKVKKDPSLAEHLEFENDLQNYLYSREFEKYSDNVKHHEFDLMTPATDEDQKLLDAIKNNEIQVESSDTVVSIFRRRSFYYMAAAVLVGAVVTVVGINYFQSSNQRNTSSLAVIPKSNPPKSPTNNADSIKKAGRETSTTANKGLNYAALVDTFYKKDHTAHLGRVTSKEIKDFDRGDYSSIQKLNVDHIVKSGNANTGKEIKDLSYYYKGLSYMETNNPQEAVKNLQRVVDSTQNTQLKIKAYWYLALAYLKDNDAGKATFYLVKVKDNTVESDYKQKAALLLNKIQGVKP